MAALILIIVYCRVLYESCQQVLPIPITKDTRLTGVGNIRETSNYIDI